MEATAIRDRGLAQSKALPRLAVGAVLLAVVASCALMVRESWYVLRFGFAPSSSLVRLGRNPGQKELEGGRTRGVAKVSAVPGAPYGACRARQRSKKGGSFKHVRDAHGGSIVTFEDGSQWQVPASTNVEFGPWTPDPLPRDPDDAELVRFLQGIGEMSHSGTMELFCLHQEEVVYVHACAGPARTLVACDGESAVVMSPGRSVEPIRTAIRARVVGAISGIGFGVLVVALMARLAVRVPREIVSMLAAYAKGRPWSRFSRPVIWFWLPILVGVPAFLLCRLGVPGHVLGPWLSLILVIVLTGLYAEWTLRRLVELAAARRVVSRTTTTLLRSPVTGERCELSLRVTPDAPTYVGPSGGMHAAIRVVIAEDPEENDIPGAIPVQDASGRGLLDLRGCVLDVMPDLANEPMTPSAAEKLLADLGVKAEVIRIKGNKGGTRPVTVSWYSLDPGDPLLVYGSIERVLPSEAGVAGDPGYRDGVPQPVVRARSKDVVVYMGQEALLLRRITRELGVLVVLSPILLATLVGAALLAVRLP